MLVVGRYSPAAARYIYCVMMIANYATINNDDNDDDKRCRYSYRYRNRN